jgi:DNA-binding SARP family transcriptional activator
MLEVKLFGAGAARYIDRPMDGFPGHQSYQVLCYLLLNREHVQKRERLASIFWGNYATNASRKYLRNALWKLRSVFQSVGGELDDYVQVDDETVAFQKSSPYRLDVETFETLLTGSRNVAGENLCEVQVDQLAQAVNLYHGDLLEGVDEEWCLYERERLSLLHLSALSKLMVYHRAQRNFMTGLDYGERILAFDNTRENVHREMMLLHWLNGEQHVALAQFNRCAQILRDQVGVAPTEETRSLYEKMLHNQFEPARFPVKAQNEVEKSGPVSTDEMMEYALVRIHHLKQMVEETNQELCRLEEQIRTLKRRNNTHV